MNNPFEAIELRLDKIDRTLEFIVSLLGKEHKEETEFLTADECAEFLKLAKPTIYTLTSKGTIPFMKRGKRIYFKRSDLIQYLNDGLKETAAQIQERVAEEAIVSKRKKTAKYY